MGVGLSLLVSCVGAMDVIGALGYITNGLVRRNNGYEYVDDDTATDDSNLDGFLSNVKESIGNAPTSRVEGVTVAQDGIRYKDGYRVDENIDEKQLDALNDRLKSLSQFAQGVTGTSSSNGTKSISRDEGIKDTPQPETFTPKTPEPEPKISIPEPHNAKTPEPDPVKMNTPEPELKEKTPEPPTALESAYTIKTPEPEQNIQTPEPSKVKTPEQESEIGIPETPKIKTPESMPEINAKTPDPSKVKTPEPESEQSKTPDPEHTFKPIRPLIPEQVDTNKSDPKSLSPLFITPVEGNKDQEDVILHPQPVKIGSSPTKQPKSSLNFIEEAKYAEEKNRITPMETIINQKTAAPSPLTEKSSEQTNVDAGSPCPASYAVIKIDEDLIPIAVAPQLSAAQRPQTPKLEVTEPECVKKFVKPHFDTASGPSTSLLSPDDGEQPSGSGLNRQRSESPKLRPIVREDELRKTMKARASFKSTSSKEDREEELRILSALEDEEMKLMEDYVPLAYTRSDSESHHRYNISPIIEGSYRTSSEADVLEEPSSPVDKTPDMKHVDISAPWSPQTAEGSKTFDLLPKNKKTPIAEEQEEEITSEDDEELKEIERISKQETQKWLESAKFEHIEADHSEVEGITNKAPSRNKRSVEFPTTVSPTPSSGRSSPFLTVTHETIGEPLGTDELNILKDIRQNSRAMDNISEKIRRERSRSPKATDDHIKDTLKPSNVDARASRRSEFLNEIRSHKRALKDLDVKINRERSRSRTPERDMHRLSPLTIQNQPELPITPSKENVSTKHDSPGVALGNTANLASPTIVPEIRLQDINAFTKQFDNNDNKDTAAELASINFGAATFSTKQTEPTSSGSSNNSPQRELKKSKSNLKELVTSHRELQADDDLAKNMLSPQLLSPGFRSQTASPSGRRSRSKSREPDYTEWYERIFEPTISHISVDEDDDFDDDEISDEVFDEPDIDDSGPLVLPAEPEKPKTMELDVSEEYCNDPQVQEFASYIKRLTKSEIKDQKGTVSASFIAQEVKHVSSTSTSKKSQDTQPKDEDVVEYYWKPGSRKCEPVNPTTTVVLKEPPPDEQAASSSSDAAAARPVQLKARRNSIIIPRTSMAVIDETILYQEQQEAKEYQTIWGVHTPPRRCTTPEIYTNDSDYQHMQSYEEMVLRRSQKEEELNKRRESIDSIIIPRFVTLPLDDALLLQEEREAEEYRALWGITITPSRRNTTPAVYSSAGDPSRATREEALIDTKDLRSKLEKSLKTEMPSSEFAIDMPDAPQNSRASSIIDLSGASGASTSQNSPATKKKSEKRRKSLKDSSKKKTLAPLDESKPSKPSKSTDPNLEYIGDNLFPYARK